jgi:hypothetical protein
MMKSSYVILAVLSLTNAALSYADSVTVSGGDGSENGILVDGTQGGTFQNDDRATGPDGSGIVVGPFSAAPGEAIAYTVGHAPTLNTPINWSAAADNIGFPFDPKYKVKFRIWIVKGPFAAGQTRAVNACIRTSQIWRDERQGLGFSTFQISDATATPNAPLYHAFNCAKAGDMKTDIGFDNNAVNVYYVDTVDFGTGAFTSNGVWCGGNVVAMGQSTSDHLFSHEIGHAYDLQHVNSIGTFFDTTNVMHNASNDRNFLTEGQTFRAVFNPASVINSIGDRVGPTRACDGTSTSTTDASCPALQKRIWSDGASWPPN